MEVLPATKQERSWFERCRAYALPALVLLVTVYVLKDYFAPGIQIILAMLVAPFVFTVKQAGKRSYAYGIAAAVFLMLYGFLQIYVLLFLSAGCLLLFSIEYRKGTVGILPFLFLVSISPALHYLVNVFTFSIRLELSKYASILLNKTGYAVENKGAYFIMADGYSFSVDTTCIGLNMFNTGLCIVLLLIGFSQQNTKKNIGVGSLLLIFISTCALLVLTNLLRIVAIVFFRSEPGTASHEIIGLASLILYTLIPAYFLIRFLTKRYGTLQDKKEIAPQTPSRKGAAITLLLCIALLITSGFVKEQQKQGTKDLKLAYLSLPGYTKQVKEDGVYEFRKADALIYIKPANKAYASDHPPAMCWQGSGFELEEITELHYGNFTVLNAILKRDSIVQYTAWWYDNGSNKTVSQWEWRFSKGESYRIINITTGNKEYLDELCRFYVAQKLF